MQVQVNTDDNIDGKDELTVRVESEIRDTLRRFADHITRVEIHLADENAGRAGSDDKRCLIEARLAGRQPEAVTHRAGSVDEAFRGAARKMQRSLDSTLGRLTEQKGSASIRTKRAY